MDDDPYVSWPIKDRPKCSPSRPSWPTALAPLSLPSGQPSIDCPAMTWKPSEDHDREIRRWMKAKGWEVNRINYDSDRPGVCLATRSAWRSITHPQNFPPGS